MEDLCKSVIKIRNFQQGDFRAKIGKIQNQYIGKDSTQLPVLNQLNGLDIGLVHSAIDVKNALGQINEVVHAAGILLLLPQILQENEFVEYMSLAAGNTGKKFDLETNLRVAEFKFISWRGGSETIRQNQLFKDFFYLAEENTVKKRYLYVLGLEHPINFLTHGRNILKSVCSRNAKLARDFEKIYGTKFNTVCEYYNYRKDLVEIIDIIQIMPSLASIINEF